MVTDPKDRENQGSKKNLEQTEGENEELRDEQLKDVAGGIDYQSWRNRTPQSDDRS